MKILSTVTHPFINLRFFCASVLSKNFLDDRVSKEALFLSPLSFLPPPSHYPCLSLIGVGM